MTVRMVVGLVLAVGTLVTGCGSSTPAAAPTHIAVTASSAPTAADMPADTLHGLGSTRSLWAAYHQADLDPHLVSGCCFGPRVNTTDQHGADTYDPVEYGGGYVVNFTENFTPHTAQPTALKAVSLELPPDSRVVHTSVTSQCGLIEYKSRLLKRSAPSLGQTFTVGLYSPEADAAYSTNNVEQAIVGFGSFASGC